MGKDKRIRKEKLRNDESIEWKTVINRFGYIVSKRVNKEKKR